MNTPACRGCGYYYAVHAKHRSDCPAPHETPQPPPPGSIAWLEDTVHAALAQPCPACGTSAFEYCRYHEYCRNGRRYKTGYLCTARLHAAGGRP